MMIQIEEKDFIGKGVNRTCYRNQSNPDQCIKFIIPERKGAQKRMDREIKELVRLKRKSKGEAVRASLFVEEVMTSRGQGYIFELIRDSDGHISKTLDDYYRGELADEIPKENLFQMLQELYRIGFDNQYILSELHEDNIAVKRDFEKGVDQLIIIDGLGNFDFIKCCNWNKRLAQNKLERKFRSLAKRMGVSFEAVSGEEP